MKTRTPVPLWILVAAIVVWVGAQPGPLYPQDTWDWGELAYGRTYDTKLEVPSTCPCSVEVTIEPSYVPHPPFSPQLPPKLWQKGNPYLTIAEKVIIPPGGGSVPARIKTPAPPPIQRVQGVALNDLTVVEGELKLTARPLPNCCDPRNCDTTKTFKINGHIHLDAGGGGGGGGGLEPVNCDGYWDDGKAPPSSWEEHCRDRLRQLARHYIEQELAEAREEDPGAWSWLPSSEEIEGMSTADLLAMKARAESIRGSTASRVEASAAAR